METNSSGDELLKTSSKDTNCLETKSRGTIFFMSNLVLKITSSRYDVR